MRLWCRHGMDTIFRVSVEEEEITCLDRVSSATISRDQESLKSILIIYHGVGRVQVIREQQQGRFQRHSGFTGRIMSTFISKKSLSLELKKERKKKKEQEEERYIVCTLTDLLVLCQLPFRIKSFFLCVAAVLFSEG